MKKLRVTIFVIFVASIFIAACSQIGSQGEENNGTKLRVLPNYALSACLDVTTGISYVNAQTLMAAGGSPGVAGYTWSADFSTFPAGTTIEPLTGVFEATGGSVVPGTYNIPVKVSDGSSTAAGTVALIVTKASSECPLAVLQQYPVSPFILDEAVANKPYGATLFAMGGTPPYSWREDTTYAERSDFDSSGLTIDSAKGIIRGIPFESASGKTLKFRLIVKDSAGETSSGSVYEINVQ